MNPQTVISYNEAGRSKPFTGIVIFEIFKSSYRIPHS